MNNLEITSDNAISLFLHCGRCIDDIPEGFSPRDWMDLEVGWSEFGLQVWCKRHNANVIHIDFEGAVHPANTRAHL
ncbi:hypothetical protein LCGC14_2674390 [marine sediment metagenome]|uniref:Uncharacterized protein n=1 Tax=marine sediment metagenome TaxID=412755 RepID=A0A0F8ZN56_9ZZZZ